MIVSALLNLTIPVDAIQREVTRALQRPWQNHYNTRDFTGKWTVFALRSPGGDPDCPYADEASLGEFADTPFLEQLPALSSFLNKLPFETRAIRLLNLAPGSEIRRHRDYELAFEKGEMRLHIPIFTNPGVRFKLAGMPLPMRAGECWYINANLYHSVVNTGEADRIHLVIDCRVNDWLAEQVAHATQICTGPDYDEPTAENMIEAFHNQGTPGARQMAAELDLQLKTARIKDWIPYKLVMEAGTPACYWLYTAGLRFNDPFFSETVAKCLKFQPDPRYRVSSSLAVLPEWSAQISSLPVAGIIFHVSRCGSTLLAQLLGLDRENVVLAEVPFLDDLLRLLDGTPEDTAIALLRASVALYAQPRTGQEKRVFIKTDSWHMHKADLFRKAFPETPFFLLYRRPDEVLRSHQKLRGMQAVPGVVPDHLLGISGAETATRDLDERMKAVLQSYQQAFDRWILTDKASTLLNYQDGPEALLNEILLASRVTPGEKFKAQVRQRANFNAKFPDKPFSELPISTAVQELSGAIFDGYRRLEAHREASHRPG